MDLFVLYEIPYTHLGAVKPCYFNDSLAGVWPYTHRAPLLTDDTTPPCTLWPATLLGTDPPLPQHDPLGATLFVPPYDLVPSECYVCT